MHRVLLAAVLAATSCATIRPECAAHGSDPWLQLDSAHFSVTTNLPADSGRAAVLQLERSLGVVRHAFAGATEPSGRIAVVLFRDWRELQDLNGSTTVLAELRQDWHGTLMLMGNTLYVIGSTTEDDTVLHELTHYAAAFAFARQPRWFAEGLAMYFQTAKVDENGQARLGDAFIPALNHVRSTNHLTLDELWAWDADTRDPDENKRLQTDRYAASWLFVHYFYNQHERHLTRFLRALTEGGDARAAFNAAFEGISSARLDEEAQTYVEGGKYRAHLFAIEPVSEQVETRRVPDATAHALFARIATQRQNREEARARVSQELTAALALDPTDALALELQILSSNDAATSLERARTLTVTHPEDARGWRLLAMRLLRNRQPPGEVLAALRQAHALAPDDANVLGELAAMLGMVGEPGEALTHAIKAVTLAPYRPDMRLTLALTLAQSGRCDEAAVAFNRAKELLDERLTLASRKRFLELAQPVVDRCPGSGL